MSTESTSRPASPSTGDDPRKALTDAERAAAREQPGSFRDDAMTDKIVEVDPIARDDAAIKGIDPK